MSAYYKESIEAEISSVLRESITDYNSRQDEPDLPDCWINDVAVVGDVLELTAFVKHDNGQTDKIVIHAEKRSYFNYRNPHRTVGEFMWRVEEIVDTYETVGGGESYFTLPSLIEG